RKSFWSDPPNVGSAALAADTTGGTERLFLTIHFSLRFTPWMLEAMARMPPFEASTPAAERRELGSSLDDGRPRDAHVPQQSHEGGEPLAPVGVDIDGGVVEEAGALPEPVAARRHVVLDDLGRGEAVAARGLPEVAAGVIENVAAAPVDELQHAQHGK